MATTATIKTSSYDGRYYQLECIQTKNIAANTSTINWTLKSIGGNSKYYTVGPTTVVINGVTVYEKARLGYTNEVFPVAKGSTSGTTTVAHDAGGKATITISLSTAIYTTTKRNASANWVLDDIPRAAQILSAPDFNDEETTLTITYNNVAGAAVDKLEACIALYDANSQMWHSSGADYREISKSDSSYTFNLTAAEQKNLRKAVTKQDGTLIVKFYIRTTIAGAYYLSSIEKNFSLINFTPTIAPTIRDIGGNSTQLTGNPQKIIKGFNVIEYNIGGQGRKEAYITNQQITCGSQTTTNATGTLTNVDSAIFNLRVIDNRNTITEETVTLGLIEYKPLTCNLEASIMLSGETISKIDFTIKGNYWNGNFGAVDNTLTVKYRYKANSGNYGEWISATDGSALIIDDNGYSVSNSISNLDYQNSYTIQAIAYDAVNTSGIESNEIKLKTIPVFDWSETDFNFNVPVSINGIAQDYIVESGKSGIWTYEKWASGKALCWGVYTHNTSVNSLWQNGVYTGDNSTSRINYPFTFIEKPVETTTLMTGDYATWQYNKAVNGASATGDYNVARFGAVSSRETFYFNFYILGRWR